jgi:hypothetical protein
LRSSEAGAGVGVDDCLSSLFLAMLMPDFYMISFSISEISEDAIDELLLLLFRVSMKELR